MFQALLTGTVPSFWDVLFNYNSSRLELDNLLFQYRRCHPEKKIVFYGDETWLKLFPQGIFARSEALQSFFVQDYQEVRLSLSLSLWSSSFFVFSDRSERHSIGGTRIAVAEGLGCVDCSLSRSRSHWSRLRRVERTGERETEGDGRSDSSVGLVVGRR